MGVVIIIFKSRKRAGFALVDGLMALGLITAMVCLELDAVVNYQTGMTRSRQQFRKQLNRKELALQDWQSYKNREKTKDEQQTESLK